MHLNITTPSEKADYLRIAAMHWLDREPCLVGMFHYTYIDIHLQLISSSTSENMSLATITKSHFATWLFHICWHWGARL